MSDVWRYEPLDVSTDPGVVARELLARIADRLPGWVPHSAAVEVIVSEEIARLNAVTRETIQRVADWILAEAGQRLHGVDREFGSTAGGTVTFTMLDDAGYNIPGGTRVGWNVSGSERVEFATVETLTINAGSLSGDVDIDAVEAGAHANGLGPGEPPAVLLETFAAVDTVEFAVETSGGADPETLDQYLARLIRRLQLLHITAIHADHFAILAADVNEVHRATALNLYDPAAPTATSDGHVTVVALDDRGVTVSTTVRNTVEDALAADRVLNVVVHTMDATYTTIDLAATVRRTSDVTAADLADRCEQAIRDWLSPAHWGDPAPHDDLVEPAWILRDTVRHLEAASILAVVAGVDFVESLTLDGGTADVALSGDAPLPAPFDDDAATELGVTASTVSITVTDPT